MKITIKVGDQTHEVDHEDSAVTFEEGLVVRTQTEFNTAIQQAKDVQKKASKKTHEESIAALLTDDAYFQKVAGLRGIDLDDKNLPVSKEDPARAKQQKEAWVNEYLDPKLKEIERLNTLVDKGHRDGLERDIFSAAPNAGVIETRLKTIFKGAQPEFIKSVADMLTYDPERNDHYYTDDIGSKVYSDSNGSSVEKLLVVLRKRDADNEYFKDPSPDSSGFKEGGHRNQTVVSSQSMADGNVDIEAIASGKTRVVN